MNQTRTQNILLFSLAAWVAFSVWATFKVEKPKEIRIPVAESAPSYTENPQDRRAYEITMLADPNTGKIPDDIGRKERAFAQRINEDLRSDPLLRGVDSQEGVEELTWSSVGPVNFGGRTRAIAIDVTDEQILLAGGVSGGVWRSENGGASWTKTTGTADLHSVTAIVQDTRPGKTNIWYYGTGELIGNSARALGAPFRGDGIYKSTDGGRSWQLLPSTSTNEPATFDSPFNYIWDLALNPNSSDDEIIAAIFGGLVKSTDGGNTWTTVLGNDALGQAGTDLNDSEIIFYTDVHRTSNGDFYATLSNITNTNSVRSPLGGIYRSEDNGDTWTKISAFPTNIFYRRTEIGSSEGNPNVIYFISDTNDGHVFSRYDVNTEAFVDLTSNLPAFGGSLGDFNSQNSYNLLVSVHPQNDNVVFLGGRNLYRSTDGFTSTNNTNWIGGYNSINDPASYANHHPDQHKVVFFPSNPNTMLSANDGGIFKTLNNLNPIVQYESLNNNYVTTQFYTGHLSKYEEDNFVLGGTQDNGTLFTPSAGGPTQRVLGGDGAYAASTRFGIYYYVSFQNSRIFRVTLSQTGQITSFARVDPIGAGQAPGQSYLFINPYVLDPNSPNQMYLAGGNYIWRNNNLAQIQANNNDRTSVNWDRLETSLIQDGSISALDVSTDANGILVYGSTSGSLIKLENAEAEDHRRFNLADQPGVNFPRLANVSSIKMDPTNSDNFIVTFSNYGVPSIFYTQDGGETFSDVSGNLEENPDGTGNGPSVRWATIVPLDDDTYQYYVGTSTGLYSTTTLDGSSTVWVQEGTNTIGNMVVNMIDFRRSDGRIVAATHGNGLYTSQIPNVKSEEPIPTAGELSIETAFPNPFSDAVKIRFNIPESGFVSLRVYNSQGQLVRVASPGLSFVGENLVTWDGNDQLGQRVKDGIYIIRLTYDGQNDVQRVILSRN